MSEERTETARRTYEAFNRGDRETWLAVIHPEAEIVMPIFQALEGGAGARHGHAGANELWENWHAVFRDPVIEVKEIRHLGETTFVAIRLRGQGAGSDVPIDQPAWHVVRWRDGKVIRIQAFLREAEALEAAGLTE